MTRIFLRLILFVTCGFLSVSIFVTNAATAVPIIESINVPDVFPSNERITIKAINLGQDKTDNIVELDGKKLNVADVRAASNEIDVYVTSILHTGDITITVNDVSSNPYHIVFPSPTIDSIEFPNGLEPGLEFQIHGSNFNASPSKNSVVIYSDHGEVYYPEIVTGTANLLVAKIPEEVLTGRLSVSKNGWISNDLEIELPFYPVLDSISYNGTSLGFGDILTLKGEYFNDTKSKNSIVFEDGDGDPDTGTVATPYYVDSTGTEMKVIAPTGIKSGNLYLEINDFKSNFIRYELHKGPKISFNDHSAYLNANGEVVMLISSNDFSTNRAANIPYINGTQATVESMILAPNGIVVNFGLPDPSGTIYVETNGYRGDSEQYDFSWLLVPKISSLETNNGFFQSKTVTIRGINFSADTILATGEKSGELQLSAYSISPNELKATISANAVIGQEIKVSMRNGFYTGNTISFLVGDESKTISAESADDSGIESPVVSVNDSIVPEALQIFPDVPIDDWYSDSVATLKEKGIFAGKDDGNFHPNDFITRAEFLKAAILASGVNISQEDIVEITSDFSDSTDHWARDYIRYARAKGLIINAKYFSPDRAISRSEAVKILLEAFNIDEIGFRGGFTDIFGHWSEPYVAKALSLNLVEGTRVGIHRYFYPDSQMNRAEGAEMIARMFEIL